MIGVCKDIVFKVKMQTRVPGRLFYMFDHLRYLIRVHPFTLCQVICGANFGIGFELRVKLKTSPNNLNVFFSLEAAKGFFKLSFSYITKRTSDVRPYFDFHFFIGQRKDFYTHSDCFYSIQWITTGVISKRSSE